MRLLRYVLLALLFVVTTGGLGPALARALGATTHVCQCAREHQDCLCDLCHPDQAGAALGEARLKGRCGEDRQAELATARLALPPRREPLSIEAAPADAAAALTFSTTSVNSRGLDEPPEPPPRSA